MAGGASTVELVAAVSNAGGLGTLAGALLAPQALADAVDAVRKRSVHPIGINLFMLNQPTPDAAEVARALQWLDPVRAELGLPPGLPPTKWCENFHQQFAALVELRPALASFTFGILDKAQVDALHAGGSLVMGTATTVAEARLWESVGADFICAQGAEAGGHRGTFLGPFEDAMIGCMALVPQIVDAVRVPVLAAGGIMDGRGIAAALMLGASGCQLGTAFLTCPEAGIHPAWKALLREARDDATRVTRVFSGKPARGLVNDFMRRFEALEAKLPPYPVQNALTGEIRQAATKAGRMEYLSLWAGQAARLSRGISADELVGLLATETIEALRRQQP